MLAQMLWQLAPLPLWYMARHLKVPLAEFSTFVQEQQSLFAPARCACARIPTADDIDLAAREEYVDILARVQGCDPAAIERTAGMAAEGSTIREIASASGMVAARIEMVVRALGYSPPNETRAGLAQFRLLLTEQGLADALGLTIADVTFVQSTYRRGMPVYRFLNRRLTVDSVNLILEWSGKRVRWRTTVAKRKWWLSASSILRRYDLGESVAQLSGVLGVQESVMYNFLHRHQRDPFRRMQCLRHGQPSPDG